MEQLRDMHPAFLRFPGGNYLEGNDFDNRFDWKTTIGPLEKRPGHKSPWGYRSTDGLGLLEFLQWCEDLHMQPVLAVFAGFCLNGRYVATGDDLKPHVQDALDEIEYVTGDANTTWGSKRAADGHPAPFHLTYVEIGNEDNLGGGASTYEERFAAFYDAIKAKYPKLQVIATMPVHDRQPDVVDDHFYRSARQMQRDVHHYDPDKTLRNGPKIFVGEWATKEGTPTPNMNAALGDAAWMTGMERNSDQVIMSVYAPLLVNVNPGGKQWSTNLIGYNALNSFGSPSYYAQAMFSRNRGDTVLHFELTQPSDSAEQKPVEHPHGSIGLATWNTVAEYQKRQSHQRRQGPVPIGIRQNFRWLENQPAAAIGHWSTAPIANRPSATIAAHSPATPTGPTTPSRSKPEKFPARKASWSSSTPRIETI